MLVTIILDGVGIGKHSDAHLYVTKAPARLRTVPDDLISTFVHRTGCGGVLSNKPASGTAIIEELGSDHERSGRPIVYTSADRLRAEG